MQTGQLLRAPINEWRPLAQRFAMDGSPLAHGGTPVLVNHNGLEEEEDHDLLDASSEDEESPPHLIFTDGSCSDSQLSQDGTKSTLSACDNFDQCRSPDSQICASTIAEGIEDCGAEVTPKKESDGSTCLGIEEKDVDIAVEPSTSYSPYLERDEGSRFLSVDMDVSSGDDLDEPKNTIATLHASTATAQLSRNVQPTLEEKRRIEENIQALMREFERKRLEEKILNVASTVNLKQQETATVESKPGSPVALGLTSVGDLQNAQGSSCCDGEEQLLAKPEHSPTKHSPPDDSVDALSITSASETRQSGRDDGSCELPSSSVEVPPVPTYEEIEQCIYRVESKKKAVSLMCFCRSNDMDCSDSRCDNRAMLTECPKNCLGKDKDCKNRRFAKREYAAVQAFYTGPSKGFGVQAVAPIKKGQFIIEYVGEVVSSEEFAKRLKRYGRDPSHTHHYMFEIGSMIIDATKKGNCSRFMNHSCEPNAVCEKWYVPRTPCAIDRIGFFAKRDIELGEEITFDYQFENYGREAQRCFCGTPSCTGWIGKPPEMVDDGAADDESESESDDSDRSADEEVKASGRIAPARKKHRFRGRDNLTLAEIEERLEKALATGCRNRTHVLGWIKLMTEITILKNESGVLRPMHRIADSICSIEPSLQHIFVANGLPNIFKMWLRTCFPDVLFGEALDLKLVIIRSLTMMQSCADAINARAPEILPMVADLASLTITDSIYVRDTVNFIVDKVSETEGSNAQKVSSRIPLEVRIDRLTRAAIRLQAVLQQHVTFRIPKKKTSRASGGQEVDQLSSEDHDGLSRSGHDRFLNFRDRRNGAVFSSMDRFCTVVGQRRPTPRFRISRWSNDRPLKRTRSSSRERSKNAFEHRRFMKRNRLIDDEPIIVTKVIPNWPRPTITTSIPPPPPQILSPPQVILAPPPPALPPVFPPAPPFNDYVPYPGFPTVDLPGFHAPSECPQAAVDDFDPEECRKYYEAYDILSLQQRSQSLLKEMAIVQSILEQKIDKKQPSTTKVITPKSPPVPKTPPPPPPLKEYLWRKAVDEDGAKYYYHKITRESVWELPEGEESDPGERTPTRMPDTSGCGNDLESDSTDANKQQNDLLLRWSSMCSPQVSTSTSTQSVAPAASSSATCSSLDGTQKTCEKKRDRERHVWERFASDVDRKRAKKLMGEIEKVVGPIIIRYIGHREDATKKKKEWIIKQVSKEMLKRESERPDFNFSLTEKGSKRVTDYAGAFIRRKCAKEPKELWKGYEGSP
ncbi:hypothetical protein RB195_006920 [Necator americanus]|uniref:SET domain protein n=1 Tax=Necator americanus TaxID=51031 RepID=A0ABR1BUT8_NECAM